MSLNFIYGSTFRVKSGIMLRDEDRDGRFRRILFLKSYIAVCTQTRTKANSELFTIVQCCCCITMQFCSCSGKVLHDEPG